MLVIPAIDLINGECVRLFQGDFKNIRIYSKNPVEVARKWEDMGAEWLHVIDLDGAKHGILKNLDIAAKIKKATKLKVEYGGGIRNIESLDSVVKSGIDRAIIGTRLLEDDSFFEKIKNKYENKFIISIDFDSSGFVCKSGWQEKTEYNVADFVSYLAGKGVNEIIITSISRDGTLQGIDVKAIKEVIKIPDIKFIIAGGVLDINDILKLKSIGGRISAVIIGKALYEGKIDLKEAIEISGK